MRLWLILLVAIYNTPALAGDLPRLDVETYCDRVKALSQGNGDVVRHACIEREQDAYDVLKGGEWADASDEEQSRAASRLGTGGVPANSYEYLQATLEAEVTRDAVQQRLRDQQQPNQFRFD